MRLRALLGAVALAAAGCAAGQVVFPNVTPGAARAIPATELRPDGSGPFPAVVLLHGCHGVSDSTRSWGRWLQEQGYVALIVDSWTPRGFTRDLCTPKLPEVSNTERFDDAAGALHHLHARPYVDRERIGVIGWSNGGVFAIAVVNGPSHERARRRGVEIPPPGFRAAVAFYPGGCYSLVEERVVRPLLVLIGDADDWTVPGPCVAMVEKMRAKGADASLVLYPGAYHYFDVAGLPKTFLSDVENRNLPGDCCGATVAGDPTAAADARRRVAGFLAQHLRPAAPGRATMLPAPGARQREELPLENLLAVERATAEKGKP